MRWKAKYTKADFKEGITRLERSFAWLPVYIGGEIIWLEKYEILQVYQITKIIALIDNEPQTFSIGAWTNLSTRTCK
jgi:hypothetical protein